MGLNDKGLATKTQKIAAYIYSLLWLVNGCLVLSFWCLIRFEARGFNTSNGDHWLELFVCSVVFLLNFWAAVAWIYTIHKRAVKSLKSLISLQTCLMVLNIIWFEVFFSSDLDLFFVGWDYRIAMIVFICLLVLSWWPQKRSYKAILKYQELCAHVKSANSVDHDVASDDSDDREFKASVGYI